MRPTASAPRVGGGHRLYRLADLQGRPHPELDLPYESLASAQAAAQAWCRRSADVPISGKALAVEVSTPRGTWRTLRYVSLP